MFYHVLIIIFALLALSGLSEAQMTVQSGMTADAHCGDGYCVTGVYLPNQKMINYTMVVPQGGSQLGWYAFSQGNRMAGANMVINWVNADQSVTISHRSATGDHQPLVNLVTVQEFSTNSNISKTKSGQTIWSWNMPLPSNNPQNAIQHSFAMSPNSPTSSAVDADIRKHSRYEQNILFDMTKTYTGSAPAGMPGSTQYVNSNAQQSSNQNGQSERNLNKNTTRIFLVHMLFMIIGWQICVPLAILIARYGRSFFVWFPYHRAIMIFGFLFVFVAFFLSVSGVALKGDSHFDNLHEKLGLAIFILMFVQIGLGAASHEIKKLKGKRFIGFIHIPFGLTLYGLSVWNIHEGFNVWEWQAPAYASYIIYAWAGLMGLLYIVGFALLPREYKKKKSEVQSERSSEDEEVRQI